MLLSTMLSQFYSVHGDRLVIPKIKAVHHAYLRWLPGLPRSGKISGKRNLFQVREKSGIFVDGQGNLERT